MKFLSILATMTTMMKCASLVTPLTGKVSSDYSLFGVPKEVAYSVFQKMQIQSVYKGESRMKCMEYDEAKEFSGTVDASTSISFLMRNGCKDHEYAVLYRVSDTNPVVYTVTGIVRNAFTEETISMNDVEHILIQQIRDRRGYLQLHDLKRWSSGRYTRELMLEKTML